MILQALCTFFIAKNSVVDGNNSNEDKIGGATETLQRSDDNHIALDEGVTNDDEIRVLG